MNGYRYIIDSRSLTMPEKTIFVALKSASNDGHKYINDLITKGVKHFIVSNDWGNLPVGDKTLDICTVSNTLEELRKRAAEKISKLGKPIVAITGSRGKTIVKEWLDILLEGHTNRTPRSFNSQIGVPLSILNMPLDSHPVIIETGISKKGEMRKLRELIGPDIVIITNVTDEHDDGFATDIDKVNEKVSLAKEAQLVIFPRDDERIKKAVEKLKNGNNRLQTLTWVINGDQGEIEHFDNDGKPLTNIKIDLKKLNIEERFYHGYDYKNLMTALAGYYAISHDKQMNALHKVSELPRLLTRLSYLEGKNNSKIIVDRFRSDSLSMEQALDIVRRSSSNNKWFIINNLVDKVYKIETENLDKLIELASLYGFDKIIILNDECNPGTPYSFASLKDFFDFMDGLDTEGSTFFIHSPQDNPVLSTLLGNFEARLHESTLEIDLDALGHNFNYFKSKLKPETGIICMLKAFGYGTGSVEIAKTLESKGVSAVAVAVIDEGIELREKGIKCPILVLNPHAHSMDAMFSNRLEPVVYNFRLLDDIVGVLKRLKEDRYPIHIKLETGMRRLGFLETEIPVLISRLIEEKDYIKVSSIFSHLATSDCPDMDDYTISQIRLFRNISSIIENGIGYSSHKHILNTAGIIRFPEYQMDLVRLGIGLYGVPTLPDDVEDGLEPVASLFTTIISLKSWEKGDSIGYGGKNKLKHNALIATLPIGYADGLDRRFGNGNATMRVKGVDCPTVGNICMDICMIDVSAVPDCTLGTRVEIFGKNIDIRSLADTLDTIPYEILTSVSQRVKRIYFHE